MLTDLILSVLLLPHVLTQRHVFDRYLIGQIPWVSDLPPTFDHSRPAHAAVASMGLLGGHFVDMFETRDEWFDLRMLPFILVWAIFAIVFLVRRSSHLLRCKLTTTDMALHYALCPEPSATLPPGKAIHYGR